MLKTIILRLSAIYSIAQLMSCATEAPTNYELNRRSGLSVSEDMDRDNPKGLEEKANRDLKAAKTRIIAAKDSMMPARIEPITEKIWVYDQLINDDQWMQGTYIFIEVDKGRWLPEVEVNSGNFIETGKIKTK